MLILHESSLRLLGGNELIFTFDCILNEIKNSDSNWNDIDMNVLLPSWGLDLYSYILSQFAKGLLLQMLFFPIKRQLIRSHYQSAAVAEYRFPTWSNISFHEMLLLKMWKRSISSLTCSDIIHGCTCTFGFSVESFIVY